MQEKQHSMTWLDAIVALSSRWLWLLGAAVIGAAAGLGLFTASPQVFEARAEVVPTVAGAPLPAVKPEPLEWRAQPQLPQLGADLLQTLALSGEAVGRVVQRLGLSEQFTADELARFLTAEVQEGQADREPPAVRLMARANNREEARLRANTWADVLAEYADEVARDFIRKVEHRAEQQLTASTAELEALFNALHEAKNAGRLALRDQEMFLLRQRYGQSLAQLASLSLLIDIAEAHLESLNTPPTDTEADFIAARLAAQREALDILHAIVAEADAKAGPAFGEKAARWTQQIVLEQSVLRELQRRIDAAQSPADSPQSRESRNLIARSLADIANRLGILTPGPEGATAPAAKSALDAMAHRDWRADLPDLVLPPAPTTDDTEQPRPSSPSNVPIGPTIAPVWIPPLMFPADIVGRTHSPQLLLENIRAARLARDRIDAQLIDLRQQIDEHAAATADLRWHVEKAQRRYEEARARYDALAARVQEIRLANLRPGPYLQMTSRADHTGRIVSYSAYTYARTAALIALLLACLIILTREAGHRRAAR